MKNKQTYRDDFDFCRLVDERSSAQEFCKQAFRETGGCDIYEEFYKS